MELTKNTTEKTAELEEVDFDPFAGPTLTKIASTTQSQLEIWLACMIGGDDASRSYNESISLSLKGDLDQKALQQAFEKLQQRHEMLRSTFSPDGKSICVYDEIPLQLDFQDISSENKEVQKTIVQNLHQQDAELSFDLVKGPLLRTYLVKLDTQEFILKISAHHIICDGWSFGIILENLSALYNSLISGEELNLEEPIPYSVYAQELSEHTASTKFREIEHYWLEQYREDVPVLNLPTDQTRPQTRTYKSQRSDFPISKDIIASLKNLATQKKTSLITALIAAFESYLYLLTKQDDIVIGLPASGQSATGNYELVGHCVNLLPLRTKIKGDQSFSDYLELRKSEIMDAYDHQQFTFSSLLQKLNVARDSSRVPLVPVIFNVDMGMDANVEFKGLSHELFSDPRAYENFEIFLNITGTEEKLIFEWSYNSKLFKPKSIEKMMNEFQGLLEELIEDPTVKIKNIHISGNTTLVQQYKKWNNTTVAYPKDKIVADLVNETAVKYPTKTAIYFNDQELTYTYINKQSNQFANCLIKKGIQTEDIVAVLVDRSPEMIIALLGIIKSGAAYLPLDPQYPKARIQYMLEDSKAKLIIASGKYCADLKTETEKITIEELWPQLSEESTTYPSVDISGTNLAYLLYTSGTTGMPKGVQIEHHSLINYLLSFQQSPGMTSNDKLLAITTVSFDISATELYLPLISGASIRLADSETARDGRELLSIIEEEGISYLQATPATYQMMLSADWQSKLPIKALCGGEALSKDLAEKLLERTSELWNVYGPTETTIWSTTRKIDKPNEVTVGRPIANTQIYILDENHTILPVGSTGEICIAGDGLARGYLGRKELTAEKFIVNPVDETKKIYKTGDLGYLREDGEIVCLGRKDAQVKIRGHRIELEEIEYHLNKQPGIKDAIVNPYNKDGDTGLLAYIIPDERNNAGWKERWDVQYSLAIEKEKDLSLEQQNIDIAIIHNNEIDTKAHGIEWTQEGLKRIKALNASRILELGAGGGHLMFELAPSVNRYVASDYSEVAINKLNEKLALDPKKWRHVKAFAASADDFTSVKNEQFDLVLLHSVAQYFPNLEYLLKVIERSVEALNHGGCIFIGDLQTKRSINLYFAHDQLCHAQDKLSIKEYKKAVNYRLETEEELSVDPAFFYSLSQLFPSIKAVDVQIRGGEQPNEPTKSHYDAWIYVGDRAPELADNDLIKKWNEIGSLESLTNLLERHQEQTILIQNIVNRRVQREYAALQLTEQLDEYSTVADLKRHINKIDKFSISPRDLWTLGEKLGFQTHLRWADDGSDGKIEAVFLPKKYHGRIPQCPSGIKAANTDNYLLTRTDVTNLIDIPLHQIQIWKNNLRESIPEYMVPSFFTAINRFPTTDNGKIDRKNLPLPAHKLDNNGDDRFIPPRNSTEEDIATIWLEYLKLDKISVNSNFFESGGHSLTAVRVMLAIEKKYGKKLPISVLFENSTIEKLAQLVTETPKKTKWHSLVPIKTTGSKKPIYLVHGGGFNVLTFEPFSKHMDPEQPIYALQGLGLYDKAKMLSTIEEIAAFYIREMLELDPIGPYALGGYCSGGVIAYEMATQLCAQGKRVSFLAMLDSSYDESYMQPTWMQQLARKTKKVFHLIKSSTKHPRLTAQFVKRKLNEAPLFGIKIEDVSYEDEINETYHKAFSNYRAKPLDIEILLLKARIRVFYIRDSRYYGWKSLALKGVQIHELEGDHTSFLTSPNERTFAKKLQALIDENASKR